MATYDVFVNYATSEQQIALSGWRNDPAVDLVTPDPTAEWATGTPWDFDKTWYSYRSNDDPFVYYYRNYMAAGSSESRPVSDSNVGFDSFPQRSAVGRGSYFFDVAPVIEAEREANGNVRLVGARLTGGIYGEMVTDPWNSPDVMDSHRDFAAELRRWTPDLYHIDSGTGLLTSNTDRYTAFRPIAESLPLLVTAPGPDYTVPMENSDTFTRSWARGIDIDIDVWPLDPGDTLGLVLYLRQYRTGEFTIAQHLVDGDQTTWGLYFDGGFTLVLTFTTGSPPLRQRQRQDGLAISAPRAFTANQPKSKQASTRAGWRGTFL